MGLESNGSTRHPNSDNARPDWFTDPAPGRAFVTKCFLCNRIMPRRHLTLVAWYSEGCLGSCPRLPDVRRPIARLPDWRQIRHLCHDALKWNSERSARPDV